MAFYRRYCGREALVLFEKPRPGMPMGGFTENYIRVEAPHNDKYINRIVKVRLGGFNEDNSALVADDILD